jgi:hypothetical protein
MDELRDRVKIWRGSRSEFESFKSYVCGCLYFVGHDNSIYDSDNGVIYLAVSLYKCVRFGNFSKEDNIDDLIRQLEDLIDEKINLEGHESESGFPEVGDSNTFYVNLTDGRMYRWDGNTYVVFGGYEGGQGIRINNGTISLDEEVLRQINESENDLEEFAETVPHLRYMTKSEVDVIFESVFGESLYSNR